MTERAEKRIPTARPTFGPEEEHAVCKALRSRWVTQGPQVLEFENRLSKYLGCRYVRAVNSGSSAILLALKAIDIGPGDSVIVPAFTCVATVLPIRVLGAKPIFVDVELSTFNMTWQRVANAIRPNTKAIILVHSFGRMADAASFASCCQARGIHLIEDACLALGAKQAGKSAGTFGTAGCFSFHPAKIITTGEGGAVCTNAPDIAKSVELDRNYGAVKNGWERFQDNEGIARGFERIAFNFKLTDLQASIGIVQLNKLSSFITKRKEIVARYVDAFADMPGIQISAKATDAETVIPHRFVCLWTPHPVEALLADKALLHRAKRSLETLKVDLSSLGIATSGAAQCLPELPVFREESESISNMQHKYPMAFLASKLAFALPVFPEMTPQDVEHVIKGVCSFKP